MCHSIYENGRGRIEPIPFRTILTALHHIIIGNYIPKYAGEAVEKMPSSHDICPFVG